MIYFFFLAENLLIHHKMISVWAVDQ